MVIATPASNRRCVDHAALRQHGPYVLVSVETAPHHATLGGHRWGTGEIAYGIPCRCLRRPRANELAKCIELDDPHQTRSIDPAAAGDGQAAEPLRQLRRAVTRRRRNRANPLACRRREGHDSLGLLVILYIEDIAGPIDDCGAGVHRPPLVFDDGTARLEVNRHDLLRLGHSNRKDGESRHPRSYYPRHHEPSPYSVSQPTRMCSRRTRTEGS